MAKHKKDPITEKDLKEFVANDSDFAFEMQVLTQLRGLQFECSHSGTYQDPVTDKIRQFDIRAVKQQSSCRLELAVECKNLHASRPLLLSAVPRITAEAFHDIIVHEPGAITVVKVRTMGGDSIYKLGEMVGKKTDQIGRDVQSRELFSDDSATFEKLNQAVNSCKDLVWKAVATTPTAPLPCFEAIVPVLVVPAGLLWQVDYAADGTVDREPRRVTRASLFLNHAWSALGGWGTTYNYRLSHLEIITIEALDGILSAWLGPFGFFAKL